jgi:hypothetical protein
LVQWKESRKFEALSNSVHRLVHLFRTNGKGIGANLPEEEMQCPRNNVDRDECTLLIMPPLSTTPSAPTSTISTFSMMYLKKKIEKMKQ